MNFHEVFSEILDAAPMSNAAVARATDKQPSYITGQKTGARPPGPDEFLHQVADVLSLPPEERQRLIAAATATRIINALTEHVGKVPGIDVLVRLAGKLPQLSQADLDVLVGVDRLINASMPAKVGTDLPPRRRRTNPLSAGVQLEQGDIALRK